MADITVGGNDNVLPGKMHIVVFPERTLSFPISNICHFASQHYQSTMTHNEHDITETI